VTVPLGWVLSAASEATLNNNLIAQQSETCGANAIYCPPSTQDLHYLLDFPELALTSPPRP
jgi:hypothetical protein